MKLIIQIPCLNEAETLPLLLESLPDTLPGVDSVETIVIDDGSSDDTAGVARAAGVDHVVVHRRNRGLAAAFQSGLETALQNGADIVVNLDGDNQYPASQIPSLIAPILSGNADIAIGDRQTDTIPHFSPLKKLLQRLGSGAVRSMAGADVADAASGFRAYSREAALRINVLSQFSYTMETVIQVGKLGLTVASVPISTNAPTRPSRLQRNMWHFIRAQSGTIMRSYAFYEPFRTFTYLALPFFLAGAALWLRYAYYTFILLERGAGRFVQALTIGAGLLVAGMLIFTLGIVADIAAKHRLLTQETLYRFKKLSLEEELRPPAPNSRPVNHEVQ